MPIFPYRSTDSQGHSISNSDQFRAGFSTIPIHTLTNISCTQFTSSRPNLTIFCPPAELPVLPPLNPGLVLVTILPLCKKKDGLLSYEKCTLSFGVTLVAVTA